MTFFKCEYLSRFNFQLYLAFHTALHMPALLRLKKCERYRMFCPLSQLIVQSHIRPARFLFRNTNVPKNMLQVFSHFLSSTVGKSFQPCSSFSKMESFKQLLHSGRVLQMIKFYYRVPLFTENCLLCLVDYLNRVSISFFVIEHIVAKHGTPLYPIWQRGVPLKSKRESCTFPCKELRHGNAQPIADPLNRVDR